ncbi:transposase [Rhodococcus aetherivorans]|uniref:transposase n=1 Tax=Rhodococcus aetherivorans TaxID=191292 RepID=UPI00163A8BFF|nr:transposase [Rhodococcus aetherivorans]
MHAPVAVELNADGYHQILNVDVTSVADGAVSLAFFRGGSPGMTGVRPRGCAAHVRSVAAPGMALPGASWQRCRTHYSLKVISVRDLLWCAA